MGTRSLFCPEYLPDYDFETCHSILISSNAETVYRAARSVDVSSSWPIRFLFRLRGLPATGMNFDKFADLNFKWLKEKPNHGFALGLIGQFWRISGGLADFNPREFRDFSKPGFVKAIWTFEIEELQDGVVHLTTFTRVKSTDKASRRKFARYWFFVRPFSGLVRKIILKRIAQFC